MSEDKASAAGRWYVRRNSVVKGPFPGNQISRFIVLGRIHETDELSLDRREWKPAKDYPELIPEAIRNGVGEGALRQLRQKEDERCSGDRRDRQPPRSAEILNRRGGKERRRDESSEVVKHRERKTRFIETLREHSKKNYLARWIGVALVVVVIVVLGVLLAPPPTEDAPRCDAPPAPGVNWNNCRLEVLDAARADLTGAKIKNARLREINLLGAVLIRSDLAYSELIKARLSYADLTEASLKGANLKEADLAYANLTAADLSYSDLSGAVLGGAILEKAKLDNAMWPDGRVCGPGSIGTCR